jgi:hypothetical protein
LINPARLPINDRGCLICVGKYLVKINGIDLTHGGVSQNFWRH